MSNLKDDLMDALQGTISLRQDEEAALLARLDRAQVIEPGECAMGDFVHTKFEGPDGTRYSALFAKDLGGAWVLLTATRLDRVTEPEPTDADLRAQLQAALPAGWTVCDREGESQCYARGGCGGRVGYPRYAALRRPNGIRDCAAALLTLAGEGGE